ncbi:MAG: hypothetical protein Q9M94_06060 [Candidatus Gracilibacteria bacterium]|nr:hypothetical protein [Candidatus Gracilibacteria bacterium]MDQ7023174.1 hypothetical protein [Candidatus Gracilibacteria bacterium]
MKKIITLVLILTGAIFAQNAGEFYFKILNTNQLIIEIDNDIVYINKKTLSHTSNTFDFTVAWIGFSGKCLVFYKDRNKAFKLSGEKIEIVDLEEERKKIK